MKCHLQFTSFCRDEISSQNELIPVKKTGMKFHHGMKKRKKDVQTFHPGMEFWKEHVFLKMFWRMHSNILSKVNVFEHNKYECNETVIWM